MISRIYILNMSCRWCSPTCRKWTLLGFAIFFLVLGIAIVCSAEAIVNAVTKQQLNLGSDDTQEYELWKETPIPMYIEFYLFHWNNSKEVVESNWNMKLDLTEKGPYTFKEMHYRKNVTFNNNHTLTYQTQRVWHYVPEKSKGSLDDMITTINPVLLTIGSIVKYKHPVVKLGINFFLQEKGVNLTVTKKAGEFLFDGYDDPMLDLLKKVHLKHINLPFTTFGWFANRNRSVDYDGVYNMYDGTDDVRNLGRFTTWNYNPRVPYYDGYCGNVNGTSGEMWYPVRDDHDVQIFSNDLCSTLNLHRVPTDFEMYGVTGHTFESNDRQFDNGSKYPEMECFSPGEKLPSGVRNVTECKFMAPAFVSHPHFYSADPIYLDAINGLKPNASEHKMVLSIEPATGIPLRAIVTAQINLYLTPIDRITLLENVQPTMIPAMWFKQYATLSEDLAGQARFLIMLPLIGQYIGYGFMGLASLLLIGFGYILYGQYRKRNDEESLLPVEETAS